jgi:type 1 glutamine amidotransferase
MKKLTVIIFLLMIMGFSAMSQDKSINVLVFSKTSGYRHNSISTGLKMLSDLAQERKWILTTTENAELFTPEFLKNFDVVVFLNPTQEVLNDQQQKNFEAFMASGKGFVGIHAAADCEYDWAWYGQLNGAFFKTHTLQPRPPQLFLKTQNTHP